MPRILQKISSWLGDAPIVGDFLNNQVINKYAKVIPARPRALSMAGPYPTWRGLTDRRYSGRHLPPDPEYTATLPAFDAVAGLFRQTQDRRANDTSLLFPFFAQWFTDSFLRTKWKLPEHQDFVHNESNHEIDLCQIYGTDEERTRTLRSFVSGKLKSQFINGEEYPAPLFEEVNGELTLKSEFNQLYTKDNFERVFSRAGETQKRNAFAVGLEHGNSTIGNTLMNILFMREHNRLASVLQKQYPGWDDERLFQTARNINIVLLLNIVIGDYIVHIAPVDFPLRVVPGKAEQEHWYRTNWIPVEFALLYRWHSFIPKTVSLNGVSKESKELRNNNAWLKQGGVAAWCRQASSQKAGYLTVGNTPEFLLEVEKLSLTMARACQLKSFNDYRRYYCLDEIKRFDDLTRDKELSNKLKSVYQSMDKLEWLVGIFAEDYGKHDMMGELMVTMVANDAFTQALTNPLLAKNVFNANTFSEVGLDIIKNTRTLADIVVRNTDSGIDKDEIGFKARKYRGPSFISSGQATPITEPV